MVDVLTVIAVVGILVLVYICGIIKGVQMTHRAYTKALKQAGVDWPRKS